MKLFSTTIAYALVVLWFQTGVPPKMDGVVVGVFDTQEDCCEAVGLLEERRIHSSIEICVQFSKEDRKPITEVSCA